MKFCNKLRVAVNRTNRGFTIVELLIYMGLLVILITVLTNIFVATIDTQLRSKSTSSVAQDGRFIYTRLIYDIGRAQSVSVPLNIGSMSSSLQLTIAGQNHTYSLNSGDLLLTDQSGTEMLNSYDASVSALLFRRVGNVSVVNRKDTFQINFTVSSRVKVPGGATDIKQFQTTAGLR